MDVTDILEAMCVSPRGSLVWGFLGKVAQGLVMVWGLRGVPKGEGGLCLGGRRGWVPGQVGGFGGIWGFKGVPKGEVWGWDLSLGGSGESLCHPCVPLGCTPSPDTP